MAAFYASPYSRPWLWAVTGYIMKSLHKQISDIEREQALPVVAESFAERWASPSTMAVLAGNDVAQMSLAAAMSLPDDELHNDELLAHDGFIVFTEPLDMGPLREKAAHARGVQIRTTTPVRAIFWTTRLHGLNNVPTFFAAFLSDGPAMLTNRDKLRAAGATSPLINRHQETTEEFSCLTPSSFVFIDDFDSEEGLDEGPSVQPGHDQHLRMIKALTAIISSPRTLSRAVKPDSSPRRARSRRGRNTADHEVRIVSLRNPEYAKHEMDAATGNTRTGVRQHWVRGHWRNQWHPSLQAHRRRWIDGFIKGDSDLGEMPTTTIYTAR